MDLLSVFKPVFDMLYYIIPLFLFVTLLRSSWFKGKFGEFTVNLFAKIFLDKNIYHLIKNVTLPTDDGTTQIDHIIVSIYGIFVVETKNYRGWIYGNKNQKFWTQKLFKKSYQFQNPLFQNYKHTKTLESLLGLSSTQIFSVIAFVGNATFKTEMPDNVTAGGAYVKYIRSKKTPILTQKEVHDTIASIKEGRLTPSIKTELNHIAHVKKIVSEKGHHAIKQPKQQLPERKFLRDRDVFFEGVTVDPFEPNKVTEAIPGLSIYDEPVPLQASPRSAPVLSSRSARISLSRSAGVPLVFNGSAHSLCPKCNSPMELHSGKKDFHNGLSFLRCTRYPDCQVVVDIDD
jgi:Nuclease-related domain./Topoisomerase DNA binding C4 zinc finger.